VKLTAFDGILNACIL